MRRRPVASACFENVIKLGNRKQDSRVLVDVVVVCTVEVSVRWTT